MKQVTLIAPIGSKLNVPDGFCSLFNQESQLLIRKELMTPFHLERIHGVITGLEKIPRRNGYLNKNIWEESGHELPMLYPKLFEIILSYFPMTIRFGGLNKYNTRFLSHNETPYNRSFQIQMTGGKVALVGWPYSDEGYAGQKLWELRNQLGKCCNIRHKYSNYQDNDFYVVLGTLNRNFSVLTGQESFLIKSEKIRIEGEMRNYLEANPLEIELTEHDIFFAQYENPDLPLDSTVLYPFLAVNQGRLRSFYQ